MPRPFRILIAPDAFKECMSARQAAAAIQRGAKRAVRREGVRTRTHRAPVSDGGAGMSERIRKLDGGRAIRWRVAGPLGQPTTARFATAPAPQYSLEMSLVPLLMLLAGVAILVLGPFSRTGPISLGMIVLSLGLLALGHIRRTEPNGYVVLDASEVVGLAKLGAPERDPEQTTTHGLGETLARLIITTRDPAVFDPATFAGRWRANTSRSVRQILIGLGNSATNDAGAGMLAALGVNFFDESGAIIERPVGADLVRIARIDATGLDQRLRNVEIIAACDVDNPLYGPDGAAFTFAPQKGATPEQVRCLDEGLRNFAARCAEAGITTDPNTPGTGAAGGLGFALLAFCNARLERGVDLVLNLIGFHERAARADLVLTGAGRLDSTDLRGKAVLGVSKAAALCGKPTIALVGATGPGADDCLATRRDGSPGLPGGLHACHVITPPNTPLDEALRRGPEFLEAAAERVVRDWLTRHPRA